jgi:putative ABC transport system substrate-binding protein
MVLPCLLVGGLLSIGEGRLRRRNFVSLLAGAAFARPGTASAQSSSKVFRLGALTPTAPRDEKTPLGRMLLKALELHGYSLGKNLSFEARGAGGQVSRLPELVREMKADGVDVIMTTGYPATLACKYANVLTVVVDGAGDPVATRLIDGL